jgi:hypothetical protein
MRKCPENGDWHATIRAKTGKDVTIAMDVHADEEGTFFLISLCRKNYNGNLLCNNQHREMIENTMPPLQSNLLP